MAESYVVNNLVETPPLLAMVATVGVDRGLAIAIAMVRIISLFGIIGVFFGRHIEMGGWFAAMVMLVGLFASMVYLMVRRQGQVAVAHRLIDEFGAARFRAAQPVIDEANRILAWE